MDVDLEYDVIKCSRRKRPLFSRMNEDLHSAALEALLHRVAIASGCSIVCKGSILTRLWISPAGKVRAVFCDRFCCA
jgi:hypothetical protein